MADHSFSCHFADTQIFLSTDPTKYFEFEFSFKSSSESERGKDMLFLLCFVIRSRTWELGDCVWKKKHSGKVAAICVQSSMTLLKLSFGTNPCLHQTNFQIHVPFCYHSTGKIFVLKKRFQLPQMCKDLRGCLKKIRELRNF